MPAITVPPVEATPDPVAATQRPEAIHPEEDAPKRPLATRDWAIGFLAGLGYLILTVLAGLYHQAGIGSLVLLGVAGFGLGLLAWLDHATHLILNKHNLVFGGVAVAAIAGVSIFDGGLMTGAMALAGAAGAFIFMFILALSKMGIVGGGDIKLSPIPAALLAAWNPLAPVLWLFCTFVLVLGSMITTRLRKAPLEARAMAPHMALALIPTILGAGAIMAAAGI